MPIDRTNAQPSSHLPYLDGLRGLASAWVLAHHIAVLNAVKLPILSDGELAVELFMMLSGFLMMFHFALRRHREPWHSPKTWHQFWVRRFFRIAPLYYLLLSIAIILGPWIGDWREAIAAVYPKTATEMARYDDQSPTNWLMHATFLFGISPTYSFRTALPDWSIGLEMQFYAIFPFVMLIWRYAPPAISATIIFILCAAIGSAMPVYLESFVMPSMILLKFHVFLAGMLIASALAETTSSARKALLVAIAVALPLLNFPFTDDNHLRPTLMLSGVIFAFAIIVFHERVGALIRLEKPISAIIRAMTSAPIRFLGETSYCVYLLHLLIVIPAIGYMLSFESFRALSGLERMLVTGLLCCPLIYVLARALYVWIELPGIEMGRQMLRSHSKKPAV
jgi:peptidoglycan/LPS O-acetylase OafA/YrhL